MNKIKDHALVAIPIQTIDEVKGIYELLYKNLGEENGNRLHYIEMYTMRLGEVVAGLIHNHYMRHGTRDAGSDGHL